MPRQTKQQKLDEQIRKEKKAATRRSIHAVLFFAFALIFMIYIYTPIRVPLKSILVEHFLYGMFGIATFLFPLFLIWLGVDSLDKDKRYSTAAKTVTGLILATLISGASYLFSYPGNYSFGAFFSQGIPEFWRLGRELQGGVAGGLFACPLIALMSRWGFGILMAAFIVIAVLFFFDLTLGHLAVPFKKLFAAIKEKREAPVLVEDKKEKKMRSVVPSSWFSVDVINRYSQYLSLCGDTVVIVTLGIAYR